jgi:hypothetical protein
VIALESHNGGLRDGLRRNRLAAMTEGVHVYLADAVSSFPIIQDEIHIPPPMLLVMVVGTSLGRVVAAWLEHQLVLRHVYLTDPPANL